MGQSYTCKLIKTRNQLYVIGGFQLLIADHRHSGVSSQVMKTPC